MADPAVADLVRELEKARDVAGRVQGHLGHLAESNAALHCADRVMYSPLHAAVTALLAGIDHAIERHSGLAERDAPETRPPASSDDEFAWIVMHLDRCMHGRHRDDPCLGFDCGGQSVGNRLLQPGQVIGYDRHGDHIVMPDRDHKHDPAAWRRPLAPVTTEDPR